MNQRGLTIIEVTISLAIAGVLFAGVLGIASESVAFSRFTDDHYIVRYEGDRAFTRLSEILRKIGRNSTGSITYPRVMGNGDELEFRVLADLDGNGYVFDGTTGDLEWGAAVYTIRRDPGERTLYVYQGADPVWTLGRHVDAVRFRTVQEDNTLALQELVVEIETSRVNSENYTVEHTSTGSIHMRN